MQAPGCEILCPTRGPAAPPLTCVVQRGFVQAVRPHVCKSTKQAAQCTKCKSVVNVLKIAAKWQPRASHTNPTLAVPSGTAGQAKVWEISHSKLSNASVGWHTLFCSEVWGAPMCAINMVCAWPVCAFYVHAICMMCACPACAWCVPGVCLVCAWHAQALFFLTPPTPHTHMPCPHNHTCHRHMPVL